MCGFLFEWTPTWIAMEVAQQESFAAMRQKRIDQMAKMHHQISSPKLREMLKEVRNTILGYVPFTFDLDRRRINGRSSFQKCRVRMKESRHHLHDGRRLMLGNDERRVSEV